MNNNLRSIEKILRSFSKRCKNIKYSKGLLYTFLMTGGLLSYGATDTVKEQRGQISDSITEIKKLFKDARRENNKLLRASNLELIQLMEQGEQVIKMPWSTWQMGTNYYYSNWNGIYKGEGDKAEKYPFGNGYPEGGIFKRYAAGTEEEFYRYVTPELSGLMYQYVPKLMDFSSAANSSRMDGGTRYGIASTAPKAKAPVSIELSASITPRSIGKQSPSSLPSAPSIVLPAFEPKLIEKPKKPTDPTAPGIVVFDPVDILFNGTGFGQPNGASIPRSNIIMQNYGSYLPDAPINIQIDQGSTSWSGGNVAATIGGTGTLTPGSSGGGLNAFISHVDDIDVDVQGTYNVTSTRSGFPLFISLNPYMYGTYTAPDKTFTLSGTLNMSTTGSGTIVGIEHQLLAGQHGGGVPIANVNNGTTTSVLRNTGNINMVSGKDMIGIMIDTEYFSDNYNTYFKKKPETINDGTITIDTNAIQSIGIDFGYYYYQPTSSDVNIKGPNTNIQVGNIIIKGKESYGYRQKDYTTLSANGRGNSPEYYDAMGTVSGANGVVTLQGEKNVGYSIAQGKSTGDPISNFSSIQVLVGGKNNVGFLRNANTSTINTSAMVLDGTKLGTVFNFDDNSATKAEGSALIRSDINEIIVDKDFTMPNAGEDNTFLQAGKTGTVTFNTGRTLTSTQMNKFYGMTAGDFKATGGSTGATIQNKGTLNIGGESSLAMAVATGNTGNNEGKIDYTGTKGSAIYNLGTFTNASTGEIKVSGKGNTSLYNKNGTFNNAGDIIINVSEGSTGIYSDGGTINSTSGNKVKINTDDTSTPASINKGMGVYIQGGANVNLTGAEITVKEGASGVASVGRSSSSVPSSLNLTNAKIDYSGNGYAAYVADGGRIDLSGAELTLRGEAVGYEKDLSASAPPIITNSNTKINVYSNDVTVFNLLNVTPLNLNGLQSNLQTAVGVSNINNNDGTTTYNNYKLAAIDGLSAYNIDKNLDKSVAATGGVDADADTFVKNLIVQRAKVNVLSGNNVTAHLNSSELAALNESAVVGLAMNSSTSAVAANETQINVQSGATVSADRTDTGSGGVGLFINYGEANIDNGGKVLVERHTANGPNDSGVGVYAVNGSTVNNSGEISGGGNKSIGILGLSYRTDASGSLVVNEFGASAAGQGDVTANNHAGGKITMDGVEAVGIYVENNDASGHSVNGTNAGNITMSGAKGVGMAAKNFTQLTNASTGVIDITADQGVGMFGAVIGNLVNDGIINLGDSTSESVLRIGMFTEDDNVSILNNNTINAGKNSYGIYGKDVRLTGSSVLNIGDNGVGVFSRATTNDPSGNVQIQAGAAFNIGDNEAVGVFTENLSGGIVVSDLGSNMKIGENSYGYVLKGTGTTFTNTAGGNVDLKEKSVYLYSTDVTGNITNNASLTSTGSSTYGIYSAGTVVNNGNINFAAGVGNVGIYHTGGTGATNVGNISVGTSDPSTDRYAIGMAAGFNGNSSTPAFTGKIVNEGTIDVNGAASIGMYGTGSGTEVYNGTVAGSTATINLNVDGAVGMYLDNNAKGYNYGTITTVGTPGGVVGVSVANNAEFVNYGTITINSAGGMASFNDGGKLNLKNYGTINLSGGAIEEGSLTITPTAVTAGGVTIDSPNGPATSPAVITKDGVEVPITLITTPVGERTILSSGIGMYVDTLRGTNPINGLNSLGITEADLIIGADVAESTNSKYIQVSGAILEPYIQTMKKNPQITNWNIYSASLTWLATVTRTNGGAGDVENIYLAKIPYTNWAGNEATPVEITDTYNFLDGLEQRYGVEEIGSREKQLFNKLNGIGNNEQILFFQAIDEMMGHQYANVQQRIYGTGRILDKEISHLGREWETSSKQSNKIKTFGMRDEYNTDTAGIIDYTSDAYGFAYLHEDETLKLGNSSGWYAGAVHNRVKFKDIGRSKENTTMLKVGAFKSTAFDHNGSLKWTVSGEGYVARSSMHRKYLVVDEIFEAKSDYTSYGVSVKNELSKEFRTSERTSIRPYGALKLEYGRFGDIKEKSGEIRLEVKGNDYYSIKPEVGIEFKYKQPMAVKTMFVTSLGLGYENELGKVGDVGNRTRVSNTSADWFNIKGEKDDRKGNFKADLNVGIENQKFGVTFNAGYDTKGENIRGGIGFRAIY